MQGTDRPNQFKVQGTYDLPWGTLVGVNLLAESGIPKSTIIKERTDGTNFFPYGRSDLGRTPVFSQTDLLLQQQVKLPMQMRATVAANVINLFDQKTVDAVRDHAVSGRLQRAGRAVLRRVQSGGGGGGDAEHQAGSAVRPGEQLPVTARSDAAIQSEFLEKFSQRRGDALPASRRAHGYSRRSQRHEDHKELLLTSAAVR